MKFLNCSLNEANNSFRERTIIFFGAGSWLKSIMYSSLISLKNCFKYVVDNKGTGFISCNGVTLSIYDPDILINEKDCIVILTSPVYMYDMFLQLERMKLPNSVECYAFPFMQLISDKEINQELLQFSLKSDHPVIPKIIHSFWFSGDEKPDSYKRCLDTWYETLRDYEIIEWNQNNYECNKHPFLKKAIEVGAWAFASDYARLDVLRTYGGIYLDMDVEVFKPFDELLGNDAILAYSNNVQVDLAVMGSKKDNLLLQDLLQLYNECTVPETREEFSAFFQPSFVKPVLYKKGVRMDGSLQQIEGATVFPKDFFMPQDHVLFFPYERNEYTFCNHLDNFGWSFSGENKREKKIRENRLLWEKIE